MNTDPTGMCLGAYCTRACLKTYTPGKVSTNNAAKPNSKSAPKIGYTPVSSNSSATYSSPDKAAVSSSNKNYSTSTTGIPNKNDSPSAKTVNVYKYEFKSIVPDETYEKSSKFLYRTYEHVSQPENTIKFVAVFFFLNNNFFII